MRRLTAHASIAFLLILLPLHPVVAAPRVSAPPIDATELMGSLRTLRGDEANRFLDKALRTPELAELQTYLSDRWSDRFDLQATKGTVMANQALVGVFLPVAGGAGYSALQLWFDAVSGELLSTVSLLFNRGDERTIDATLLIDGAVRMEALFTEEGSVITGHYVDGLGRILQLDDRSVPTKDLACLNDCLAGLGVPNWVLGVIAVACAIACAVTLGWGCAVCLFGLALGFGWEMGYCLDQCA